MVWAVHVSRWYTCGQVGAGKPYLFVALPPWKVLRAQLRGWDPSKGGVGPCARSTCPLGWRHSMGPPSDDLTRSFRACAGHRAIKLRIPTNQMAERRLNDHDRHGWLLVPPPGLPRRSRQLAVAGQPFSTIGRHLDALSASDIPKQCAGQVETKAEPRSWPQRPLEAHPQTRVPSATDGAATRVFEIR